jgi:DNA-binding transcriptional regulator GbsR (MarR family)
VIEKMGLLFEADGAPRTGGRLFACLLLSPEPRSLDELVEKLQVSKASVSMNARMLERFGVIRRVTKLGDRRDYYEVIVEQPSKMLEGKLEHTRRLAAVLQEAVEAVPPESEVVRGRLALLAGFFEYMLEAIAQLQERWETRHAAEGAGRGNGETGTPAGMQREVV